MKRLILSVALAAASLPAAALACKGAGMATADKPCDCDKAKSGTAKVDAAGGNEKVAEAKVKELSVDELAAARKADKTTVYDANMPEFRAQNGVIPGAKLLSGMQYEPSKELPAAKDNKVVFYCASSHCGASHMAAAKAVEAGYTDVAVLPVGLLGWKAAGQPVAPAAQPKS
jgi:rhodanese-related sulfurtransferase